MTPVKTYLIQMDEPGDQRQVGTRIDLHTVGIDHFNLLDGVIFWENFHKTGRSVIFFTDAHPIGQRAWPDTLELAERFLGLTAGAPLFNQRQHVRTLTC